MDAAITDLTPLYRSARRRPITLPVVAVMTMTVLLLLPVTAVAQSTDFPDLSTDRRVYDQTQTSLTKAQLTDLRQLLQEPQSTGADPVVLVRALDVTPEETLDQVEALQQAGSPAPEPTRTPPSPS